jgi:hypothetical protein
MCFMVSLVITDPIWNPQPCHSAHRPSESQAVCLSVSYFTETVILANILYIKVLGNNERISRSLNHPVYIKFIYNFNPW